MNVAHHTRTSAAQVRELVARPRNRLLGAVAVTGLIGGAVGAAFLTALHFLSLAIGPDGWSWRGHLLLLLGVGALTTLLTRLLGGPADVELLVDNIHVDGGANSIRDLRSLIPISLLCIGVGGTNGPEAPLVTTTGSLGSLIGTRAGLARRERRIVSIAGMAAGFTVLFGAPLGSTMFALEILHRRGLEYYEALLPAALGSLCGYGVFVVVTGLGLEPIFPFPQIESINIAALGWSVAAGVVGALVAAIFTYMCAGMRWVIGWIPVSLRPTLGGLAIGLLALASPYALTNGELQMNDMNKVHLAAATLAVAACAKLIGSAVGVVMGWKGGFIIPLFFTGYCLARLAAPHLPGANEWVLAAACMTASCVGVTKTPIGSTLVVTELAGMKVLPTTLIAALVSLLLTSGVSMIHTQQRRMDATNDDPDRHGELVAA